MLASVEVKVGAKISSIIGSLEDLMKDRVTIGLGRYKVCDELYENCCRKYGAKGSELIDTVRHSGLIQ